MERGTTLFLKVTVFLMGIPIVALCIFGLPSIANEAIEHYPDYAVYSFMTGAYGAAMPFFFALYQALKLLSYIDKNTAFSELSVKALNTIKYCAITISVLYLAVMPHLYYVADEEDAPGIIVFGMVIPFASIVIAVFAAVLQRLLNNAIAIKSENDLTV